MARRTMLPLAERHEQAPEQRIKNMVVFDGSMPHLYGSSLDGVQPPFAGHHHARRFASGTITSPRPL